MTQPQVTDRFVWAPGDLEIVEDAPARSFTPEVERLATPTYERELHALLAESFDKARERVTQSGVAGLVAKLNAALPADIVMPSAVKSLTSNEPTPYTEGTDQDRFNANHDEKGRFGEGSGGPGAKGTTKVAGESAALAETKKNGGITTKLYKGKLYKVSQGYAFSERTDLTQTISIHASNTIKAQIVKSWLSRNLKTLQEPGNHFGMWKSEGKIWLDVSRVVGSEAQAVSRGKAANQKAVFDITHGREIATGGTGT